MAANPDPKPGRWILPLVVLAMIAFTYFFVRELPEASPDTTLAGQPTTTTTEGTTETTEPGEDPELDPETQAYLDGIDEINASLQLLKTEMIEVNDGFDADPREIEYAEIEARLEKLLEDTEALSATLDALTPPTDLAVNHDVVDGAPATRFVRRLLELIERAEGLDEMDGKQTRKDR